MSKRKTRQQKIIAQLRRELYSKSQSSISLEPHQKETEPKKQQYAYINSHTPKVLVLDHPYLKHDLLKTLILTSSIIAFEILLFFLSKNHIFKLPI